MEFRLIERIRELTAQPRDDVRLGIGDDAAVLAVPQGQELVVAIDTLVDGVHFPRGTAPADIGWKALAVNLSDLAAMGATPAWALLALTLPDADPIFVDGFAEGFSRLAQPHRLALVGGDTTRGPLSISYCQRYRPSARMAQPVDTSTCHLGMRLIRRLGSAGGDI
jgi:thiamine-monophosphate kinase